MFVIVVLIGVSMIVSSLCSLVSMCSYLAVLCVMFYLSKVREFEVVLCCVSFVFVFSFDVALDRSCCDVWVAITLLFLRFVVCCLFMALVVCFLDLSVSYW